jgi:outer membrane receptor protein involved in Fe transport
VPLNRLKWNDYNQAYANYVLRRGTAERLPAVSTLDLRASLALSIAGTEVDIVVQAFNLLNSTEVVAASQQAIGPDDQVVELGGGRGPAYGLPIAYQSGRTFEVGLRFHF